MQTSRASIKLLLAILFAVAIGISAGCAATDRAGSGTPTATPDDPSQTVDCLVNVPSQEEPTAAPEDVPDTCDELAQAAVPDDAPCSEVWQIDARFPAPYYGCAGDERTDAGDLIQAFDLGSECDDPSLEGYWLYGDLMARQGGPIVTAKIRTLQDGRPDC